jgi:hypothetical protein
LESAVIFKRIFISFIILISLAVIAQDDSAKIERDILNDSLFYQKIDSSLMQDSIDSVRADTLVPQKFVGYDKLIYRNSKINLRKTLLASKNPPIRKSLGNWLVMAWAVFISLLIIFFKGNYALQYRLLNKAWFSHISFNEFFSTQTSVFKNSKLLTWLIISQVMSLGIFVVLKTGETQIKMNDFALAGLISVGSILLMMANQWLKTVFAFSFYQPSLSRDYAIIFRIQAYVAALFLIPVLLFVYYNGAWDVRAASIIAIAVYIVIVYAASLFKFIFSGHFLQNQSNFILILYLCAFEILPLLVLIKSINSLLVI